MHLLRVPSSREATLHVEAIGQRYKEMAEFVYLGGNVSADISIKTNHRIGAAWARLPTYSSPLSRSGQHRALVNIIDGTNRQCQKLRCSPVRSERYAQEGFDSLRTAHHKLSPQTLGFGKKSRTVDKTVFFTRSCARDDQVQAY